MMGRFSLLFGLLILLTGCAGLDSVKDAWDGINEYFGGKDNAEPPKELQPLENKRKVTVLWDATVGDGYKEQFLNLVPAVSESTVLAADRDGELHAYRRVDGTKLWEVETELPFSAGPTMGEGKVVLGTSNAEVAAYQVSDGALLWKSTVSSEILAIPQIANGVVVVRSSDGRISALSEKDGGTLWTYERNAPALSLRSRGSPYITHDLVLDGYATGKLIALGLKDGKLAWESTVALPHGRSEIERLVDMDSTPVARGDTLYITGYQGGVAALSLTDGEVQWRQENVSSYTGLAADNRELYLSDASSDVWKLEMRNGGDLWKQDELHQRKLTAPAVMENSVIVGDFEGYLHVLSSEDGSLQARIQVDDTSIEQAPVVFEDVLYVYTSGGKLAAVDLE